MRDTPLLYFVVFTPYVVFFFYPVFQFGKGIYFADMSSKSANYCFTNQRNNIGLLLLSEVGRSGPYTKDRPGLGLCRYRARPV